MVHLLSLCVYCGSSNAVAPEHLGAAEALGRLAAQQKVDIVFGGGRVGLMGAVADGALAEGGWVVGIIPRHLEDREVGHRAASEYHVVDSMHARKQLMFQRSDAFCVLPGGLGTLDEAFEIITWKQLGLHDKPIVVINPAGYWDPLLHMIDHQIAAGYLRGPTSRLFTVAESPEAALEAVRAAPEPRVAADSERL